MSLSQKQCCWDFLFLEAKLLPCSWRNSTQFCHWEFCYLQSTNHQRKELCNSSVSTSILIPHLQNLVKQTAFQQVCNKLNIFKHVDLFIALWRFQISLLQDLITNLLSSLQQNERVDGTNFSPVLLNALFLFQLLLKLLILPSSSVKSSEHREWYSGKYKLSLIYQNLPSWKKLMAIL